METPLENCTEPFSPPSAVRQRIEPVAAGNGSAHKAAFLHADMKEGVLGLDPRTHLLVILAAGMAALAIVGLPELVSRSSAWPTLRRTAGRGWLRGCA